MPRSTPEWIGKHDDQAVPPRVRLRVLDRFDQCCASCGRKIVSGMRWTCDHILALILGGENRESNLQPLCDWCDPPKTAKDQTDKSKVARTQKKHFGVSKAKRSMRSPKWRRKLDGTVVLR